MEAYPKHYREISIIHDSSDERPHYNRKVIAERPSLRSEPETSTQRQANVADVGPALSWRLAPFVLIYSRSCAITVSLGVHIRMCVSGSVVQEGARNQTFCAPISPSPSTSLPMSYTHDEEHIPDAGTVLARRLICWTVIRNVVRRIFLSWNAFIYWNTSGDCHCPDGEKITWSGVTTWLCTSHGSLFSPVSHFLVVFAPALFSTVNPLSLRVWERVA